MDNLRARMHASVRGSITALTMDSLGGSMNVGIAGSFSAGDGNLKAGRGPKPLLLLTILA